jgi:hypothetical protein
MNRQIGAIKLMQSTVFKLGWISANSLKFFFFFAEIKYFFLVPLRYITHFITYALPSLVTQDPPQRTLA